MPMFGSDQRPSLAACPACGGIGSVRVHAPEDYGVSFEAEECDQCDGTGNRYGIGPTLPSDAKRGPE